MPVSHHTKTHIHVCARRSCFAACRGGVLNLHAIQSSEAEIIDLTTEEEKHETEQFLWLRRFRVPEIKAGERREFVEVELDIPAKVYLPIDKEFSVDEYAPRIIHPVDSASDKTWLFRNWVSKRAQVHYTPPHEFHLDGSMCLVLLVAELIQHVVNYERAFQEYLHTDDDAHIVLPDRLWEDVTVEEIDAPSVQKRPHLLEYLLMARTGQTNRDPKDMILKRLQDDGIIEGRHGIKRQVSPHEEEQGIIALAKWLCFMLEGSVTDRPTKMRPLIPDPRIPALVAHGYSLSRDDTWSWEVASPMGLNLRTLLRFSDELYRYRTAESAFLYAIKHNLIPYSAQTTAMYDEYLSARKDLRAPSIALTEENLSVLYILLQERTPEEDLIVVKTRRRRKYLDRLRQALTRDNVQRLFTNELYAISMGSNTFVDKPSNRDDVGFESNLDEDSDVDGSDSDDPDAVLYPPGSRRQPAGAVYIDAARENATMNLHVCEVECTRTKMTPMSSVVAYEMTRGVRLRDFKGGMTLDKDPSDYYRLMFRELLPDLYCPPMTFQLDPAATLVFLVSVILRETMKYNYIHRRFLVYKRKKHRIPAITNGSQVHTFAPGSTNNTTLLAYLVQRYTNSMSATLAAVNEFLRDGQTFTSEPDDPQVFTKLCSHKALLLCAHGSSERIAAFSIGLIGNWQLLGAPPGEHTNPPYQIDPTLTAFFGTPEIYYRNAKIVRESMARRLGRSLDEAGFYKLIAPSKSMKNYRVEFAQLIRDNVQRLFDPLTYNLVVDKPEPSRLATLQEAKRRLAKYGAELNLTIDNVREYVETNPEWEIDLFFQDYLRAPIDSLLRIQLTNAEERIFGAPESDGELGG